MSVETLAIQSPLLQHTLEVPLYGSQGGKVKELPQFEESDIRKICKLGSGCHSSVYLVTTPSRHQLALKSVNTDSIASQEERFGATSDLMTEANILAGLDHENIIKIRGVSKGLNEPLGESSSQPFILLDVLSETLMDRVQRWSKDESNYKGHRSSILGDRFRKLDLKKMIGRMETTAIGVARGMTYLHNKGIVVQDLKPVSYFHMDR